MRCPNCQTEIPDGSKHCTKCGRLTGERAPFVDAPSEPSISELSTTPPSTHEGVPQGMAESLVERYEILEERGKGGMGTVYRARDRKLGREVALKRLSIKLEGSDQGIARFRNEARSIAGLKHQNIVLVYDFVEDDERHYIVMEWIEGETLSERIRRKGRLDLRESLDLMRGICKGVSHAHNNGVIHRDLKPSNILLMEGGIPKVVDFGLARMGRESDLSVSGYGMGTMAYMAPEQRRDAKRADHRSDIFALGKTFYHMVTGETPDVVDPEEIPAEVRGPVMKALKPKPADRYFSVDELWRALEKVRRKLKATEKSEVRAGSSPKGEEKAVKGTEMSKAPAERAVRLPKSAKKQKKGSIKNKKTRTGVKAAIGFAAVMLLLALGWGGYLLYAPKKIPVVDVGTGIIYLDSEPTGAKVFLNGEEVGTTPFSDDALPAGPHLVRFHKEYYRDLEQEVTVPRNEIWKQTVPLEKGAGKYLVITDPPESEIYLDGERKGISPISIETEAGIHVIRAVKGEKAQEVEEAVRTDKVRRLSLILDKVVFRDKVVSTEEKESILNEEATEKERKRQAAITNYLAAGKKHLKNGKYDRAITSFEEVLKLESKHKEAGELLTEAKNKEKEQERQKAISSHLDAGKVHLERWEYEEAISSFFDEVLKLDPEHKAATGLLARTREEKSSIVARTDDGRFIKFENDTVIDRTTGLMWAAKDNGEDIDWRDGKRYCESLNLGGYSDWRLPTPKEIDSLYDAKVTTYQVGDKGIIRLPYCGLLALETNKTDSVYPVQRITHYDANAIGNRQSNSNSTRVLPVRSVK